MNLKIAMAGFAVAALALTGCSSSDDSSSESSPSPTMSESAEMSSGTIVDVAGSTEDLSTLVTAVEAAGLTETLSGEGPYTVFAPTNEAFEALPEGVLDALLEPANQEALTAVLTYHVVPGEVTSDQIEAGDVKTVEGSDVTIETDSGVTVNGATVVTADVMADNGVVHVIDEVLIPESVDPATL